MAGSFQHTMRKYERGRDEKMNFVYVFAGAAIVLIKKKSIRS